MLSFLVKWSGGDLGRFQEFLIERYCRSVDRVHDSTLSGPSVWMQKSGCNGRKLRVQARPRNVHISLFQRCLKTQTWSG